MHGYEALVYFFGDWTEGEKGVIASAALAVTPEEIREEWNHKLGHLWVVLHHPDDGRLSAQMGAERVEAMTPHALAERIRAHAWDRVPDAWASGRRDARLRRA